MSSTYCSSCSQQLWPMEPWNAGLDVEFNDEGEITSIAAIPLTQDLQSPERREQEIIMALRESTEAAAAAAVTPASPSGQKSAAQNRSNAQAMDALLGTLTAEQLKMLLAAKEGPDAPPSTTPLPAAPVVARPKTKARVKGPGMRKRAVIEDEEDEIPPPQSFHTSQAKGAEVTRKGTTLSGEEVLITKKQGSHTKHAGDKRKKSTGKHSTSTAKKAKRTKVAVQDLQDMPLITEQKEGFPTFEAYYRPQQLGEQRGIRFGAWQRGSFSVADIHSLALCLYFGSEKKEREKREALWVCLVMKTPSAQSSRRVVMVLWNQFGAAMDKGSDAARSFVADLVSEFHDATTSEKNPFAVKQYNYLYVKLQKRQGKAATHWQQHTLPVMAKTMSGLQWFPHLCGLVKYDHDDCAAVGVYRRSLNRSEKHWRALPRDVIESKHDNADIVASLAKEMPFLQNFITLN